jgi:hypothetical protein
LAAGIETGIRGLLYQKGMNSRMAPGMRGGLYLQGIGRETANLNECQFSILWSIFSTQFSPETIIGGFQSRCTLHKAKHDM